MTVSERYEILAAIERRFSSGSWDDLDVKLLLSVAEVRKRREEAQKRYWAAHPGEARRLGFTVSTAGASPSA